MPILPYVTRVMVSTDDATKEYYGVTAELSLQDDGRTLKLWIRDHPEISEQEVRDSIRKNFFLNGR